MSSLTTVPKLEVRHMTTAELHEAEAVIEKGKLTFVAVGRALESICNRKGYVLAGYATFQEYVKKKWGWGRAHAYRLIDAAEVAEVLSPMGDIPASERQARELTRLKTEEGNLDVEALKEIVREGSLSSTSTRELRQIIDDRLALQRKEQWVAAYTSSNSVEWYTPSQYVEAAREVMGGIDLDPASCERANETVCAGRYFSEKEDGLQQEWSGRVFLNPPYGGLCPSFIRKLIEQFQARRVQQAIVLVNAHATDTSWFGLLWDYTLCFTDHRIEFFAGTGARSTSSTNGNVFVYMGQHAERFREVFQQFGRIVREWKV